MMSPIFSHTDSMWYAFTYFTDGVIGPTASFTSKLLLALAVQSKFQLSYLRVIQRAFIPQGINLQVKGDDMLPLSEVLDKTAG